jgi:2-polyprenyl-3-methyl-5-hydroxy-6-metoxy-1,4-benzoquinol methylase
VLSRPGARIADVGCGAGWASLALARAYPQSIVDGFDLDPPSIELARENAAGAGLVDRVHFHLADAAGLAGAGYDAAFAFECLHDMPAPVDVLAAMRHAVVPDGAVVVMDEAVSDEFTAPGDDVERLMYAYSVLICLPDGMAHQPSAGTGTVMRPQTLRRYAREAGFSDVTTLPIKDFGFWRFYEMVR